MRLEAGKLKEKLLEAVVEEKAAALEAAREKKNRLLVKNKSSTR